VSDIIHTQIMEWRQKSLDGTITPEEMKQAIAAIRKERAEIESAPRAKTTRTPKAKAAPVNSDDLLKELGL